MLWTPLTRLIGTAHASSSDVKPGQGDAFVVGGGIAPASSKLRSYQCRERENILPVGPVWFQVIIRADLSAFEHRTNSTIRLLVRKVGLHGEKGECFSIKLLLHAHAFIGFQGEKTNDQRKQELLFDLYANDPRRTRPQKHETWWYLVGLTGNRGCAHSL